MGRALKRVFRGQMSVEESVALAAAEVRAVFETHPTTIEEDKDIGLYGDIAGKCPLCGKEVVRGKFSYGCKGYRDGCTFRLRLFICDRAISLSNVKQLLETGRTSRIKNFISKKSGKAFDAYLRLEQDGNAVFDFSP